MKCIVLDLSGSDSLADLIAGKLGTKVGALQIRRFPDGESYVRLLCDCRAKHVIVVANLHRPDQLIMPLLFLADTAREMGAARLTLVSPYLAYMRQDERFREGEAVTARCFANLLGRYFDEVVTVDPHLHRCGSLDEVYTISTQVLSAAEAIAVWLQERVATPLLVGPDEESGPRVRSIAERIGVPAIVLNKIRRGDRDVTVELPDVSKWESCTPVLIDDIISTGQTMIQTVVQLKEAGLPPAICIAVHGVFADGAYQDLVDAGIGQVVTVNTIPHVSNAIDIHESIADFIADRHRQLN